MNNALPRRAAAGRVSKGEGGRRPCLEGWTPPRLVRPFETPRSAWLLRVRSSLHVAVNDTLTLRAAAGRVSKGRTSTTGPALRDATLRMAPQGEVISSCRDHRHPHPEGGRRPRLEGWSPPRLAPALRDATLRGAPQCEVISLCRPQRHPHPEGGRMPRLDATAPPRLVPTLRDA